MIILEMLFADFRPSQVSRTYSECVRSIDHGDLIGGLIKAELDRCELNLVHD